MTTATMSKARVLRTVAASLRAGFAWWVGELAAMLPNRLSGRTADATQLVIAADGVTLQYQDSAGAIRPLTAAKSAHKPRPATIRLPADLVLARAVTLASAAEENLHEVVGFQLDRFTPFELHEVYLGCRVIGRDTDAEAVSVAIAVAQRGTVDALIAAAARAGHRCSAVVSTVDPRDSGQVIELPLRIDVAQPAAKSSGRVMRALLVLNGALAVACVAVPLLNGRVEVAQAQAELATLRREALAVATLRDDVEQRTEQAAIPLQRLERTQFSTLLAELTRIVPDGSWVTQLEIDPGSVQLTGFAAAANGLIPALEASPFLTNASFRSPVTQDAIRGVEQFHLSVDLRKRNE